MSLKISGIQDAVNLVSKYAHEETEKDINELVEPIFENNEIHCKSDVIYYLAWNLQDKVFKELKFEEEDKYRDFIISKAEKIFEEKLKDWQVPRNKISLSGSITIKELSECDKPSNSPNLFVKILSSIFSFSNN